MGHVFQFNRDQIAINANSVDISEQQQKINRAQNRKIGQLDQEIKELKEMIKCRPSD